ncbi:MAG TPA: serine hydrolase domain-containing protein [Candidatus Cybelea sp.]|nr:serine hydrolase domain-containing protein [Candidatus Cybelea sp.]
MKQWIWAMALVSAGAIVSGVGQAQDPSTGEIARVEGAQSPNRQGFDPYTIPEMMRHFHVPGVSIAVVRDFQVEWTNTYGVADVVTSAPVTTETRFQAASISKPVTAFAVLRAVDAGKLSLDENVNKYLKTWKIPENEYTRGGVTLRALLSHTSGTGDGFGFPGYNPSAPLPTLIQILDGKPPSNVGPVFWERPPFSAEKYSGGGIVIEQLVLEDVYGKPFAEIMQEQVLGPVGMTNSTYEQPLSATEDKNAARAHDQDGKAMDTKWHVYPEQAAAGLWTTPTDLTKLGIEVQKALRGESKLLSRRTALEMVAPTGTGSFAIGFAIERRGEGWYFTHSGSNWGFRSDLTMHRLKGYGIAVMANSDSGGQIISEIEARVAAAANWDSLDKPVPR